MSADFFWDVVARLGLPFGLVALALLTGRTGLWVWGRELASERNQFAERLNDERERARKREAELLRDRDFYRDIAFEALKKAEKSGALADRAVGLFERGGAP